MGLWDDFGDLPFDPGVVASGLGSALYAAVGPPPGMSQWPGPVTRTAMVLQALGKPISALQQNALENLTSKELAKLGQGAQGPAMPPSEGGEAAPFPPGVQRAQALANVPSSLYKGIASSRDPRIAFGQLQNILDTGDQAAQRAATYEAGIPLAEAQGMSPAEAKIAAKNWGMGGGAYGGAGGIPRELQVKGTAGIAADRDVAKLTGASAQWGLEVQKAKENLLAEVSQTDFSNPANYPILNALQQKYTRWGLDAPKEAFRGNYAGMVNYLDNQIGSFRDRLRAEGKDIQTLGAIDKDGNFRFDIVPAEFIPSMVVVRQVAEQGRKRLEQMTRTKAMDEAIARPIDAGLEASSIAGDWHGVQKGINAIMASVNASERLLQGQTLAHDRELIRSEETKDKLIANATKEVEDFKKNLDKNYSFIYAAVQKMTDFSRPDLQEQVRKNPQLFNIVKQIQDYYEGMDALRVRMQASPLDVARQDFAITTQRLRPRFITTDTKEKSAPKPPPIYQPAPQPPQPQAYTPYVP